jgi:hypothetical protein
MFKIRHHALLRTGPGPVEKMLSEQVIRHTVGRSFELYVPEILFPASAPEFFFFQPPLLLGHVYRLKCQRKATRLPDTINTHNSRETQTNNNNNNNTMVIANSDSTGTLVSLGNGLKRVASYQGFDLGAYDEVVDYQQTELLLPEDIFCNDDDYSCSSHVEPRQPLYLPSRRDAIDQCLSNNMLLMERCDELLNQPPVHYHCNSKQNVLYVAQGEVAHAVQSQCDVIMSDKATTCHILALRSSCSDASSPLSSLTHIDSTSYEECVRAMIQEHKAHHNHSACDEEEKKDAASCSESRITLDVHVVGGFDDAKGSSREISNWLITLLASIAAEEKDSLVITLQTCAISSMNDDGRNAPIGRGLAMDLKTGETFLARCDEEVAGPTMPLRSMRLWSSGTSTPKLHLIHTSLSNEVRIEPFAYAPFKELDALLNLRDDILLQYTSTSPDVEDDDFCRCIRATLEFLRDVPCKRTFGDECDQPLVYQRICRSSNSWKLAC